MSPQVLQKSIFNAHEAFVYPFKTQTKYYLYDVNTNSIVLINKNIYELFKNNLNNLNDKDYDFLNNLQDDGLLQKNKIKKIEHPMTQYLEDILNRKLQAVTLQVTQNCNFRCKYCVYSGSYTTRGHTNKDMNFGTAVKAIDFVINRSSSLPDLDIGFYGGEPLIAFNLIKQVVEYSKVKAEGKIVRFHMTTNGTLLTEKIMDFLEENKFSIMISLDGPKEIHDRNRVFAHNGKGSFDIIMKNIDKIKNRYPSLYSRLMFNAVIDPSLDQNCATEFFVSCKELGNSPISASIISSEYKKDKVSIPNEYFITEEFDLFKTFLYKLKKISGRTISGVSKTKFSLFHETMRTLREKSTTMPEICHPSGPCIPGAKKLFVDVHGNLYPCEKVSEMSFNTKIGTLDSGFDIKQIKKILNIGKLTSNTCKKCWGFRLCSLCVLAADNTQKLSGNEKRKSCTSVLRGNEEMLRNYCTLVEAGYIFENEEVKCFEIR